MAKKPSLDTAKIKEFLFQKGERIGLGVSGGIALLLLVLTFVGLTTRPPAQAGGATWKEVFTVQANKTKQLIQGSEPGQVKENEVLYRKNPKDAIAKPQPSPPFEPYPIEKNDKKRIPPVMPVSTIVTDDTNDVQVEFLRAPALTYGVNFEKEKIDTFGGQAVMYLEPKHLVVVTATFPYQEQLKLFAEALQYNKVEDLLKSKDVPRFLNLNIWRTEMVPGAKEDQNLVHLYVFKPEQQKVVVHPPLDLFFRRMVIDTYNPAQFGIALAPNMATPLPYLASVTTDAADKYPPLKITGFEQAEGTEDDGKPKAAKGDTGMPRMQPQPTPAGKGTPAKEAARVAIPTAWSKLDDRELVERLKGNYNVFNPFGRPEGTDNKDAKSNVFGNQNTPKKSDKDAPAGPAGIPADEKAAELPKLLVRFIDIDLEVGKTYRYWLQVHLANPNFGNTKDVANEEFARLPDLYSQNIVPTPPVTVPGDLHYYAYDQKQPGVDFKSTKVPNGGAEMVKNTSDERAPVQIHRWIKNVTDPGTNPITHVIGDWVIAERLLVKRGDPLGHDVLVEVPEWDWRQGRFKLATSAIGPKKSIPFIPVNFMADDRPAPLLVDFQGGKHDKYHPQKTTSTLGVSDSAAVELLVLDENGKLVLHNSHNDAANPVRLESYARWGHRLDAVRRTENPGKGPTTGPPGLRGGPGIR